MTSPHHPPAPEGSPFTVRRKSGGIEINFPWQALPADVMRTGVVLTLLATLAGLGIFFLLILAVFAGPHMHPVVLFAAFALLVAIGGLAFGLLYRPVPSDAQRPDAGRLRQLAAIDGILVRKGSWGNKQIWYADEVRDIRAENYWVGKDLLLGVVLRSPDEEPFVLYGAVPFTESTPKQRAELEWIAAELRQAMEIPDDPQNPAPQADMDARTALEGITEKSPHVRPRD